MNGFYKWLSSTKFQICVLVIGLVYLQQELYGLNPEIVTDALIKIALGYFSARILEPIVEFLIRKLEILKK